MRGFFLSRWVDRVHRSSGVLNDKREEEEEDWNRKLGHSTRSKFNNFSFIFFSSLYSLSLIGPNRNCKVRPRERNARAPSPLAIIDPIDLKWWIIEHRKHETNSLIYWSTRIEYTWIGIIIIIIIIIKWASWFVYLNWIWLNLTWLSLRGSSIAPCAEWNHPRWGSSVDSSWVKNSNLLLAWVSLKMRKKIVS